MRISEWSSDVCSSDLTIVSHTEPMDIGIYARDDYYFNYRNADFKALMAKAEATVDENARNALLAEAQKKLAADAVNVFLFQLAKHGVWDRDVVGLWEKDRKSTRLNSSH